MGATRNAEDRSGPARRLLLATLCVLLLMWPALVNRQPFYFPDTSSYVRAGDAVAHLLLGDAATTIWSPVEEAPATPERARGNDPDAGYVMAGRSPYFGLLLWAGWVTSGFWLFVMAQALVAFWLIALALRGFGADTPRHRLLASGALGLLTPLAIYNGVLLADALAGFGIAALLVLPHAGRWERAGLVLLVLVSACSHLTHIVMMLAVAVLLVGLALLGRVGWSAVRAPIVTASAAVLVGFLSVMATSWAVEARYGSAPQLVPLLTARITADGPGRDFIKAGCGGRRFAVCAIPYREWRSADTFLWSRDPAEGAFILADAETKARLSQEDKAFAVAVARAYPLGTLGAMAWNTVLQLVDIRTDIVDARCYVDPACLGDQFPPQVTQEMARTPAGQGAWPVRAMDAVMYAAALASLAALAVLLPQLWRRDAEAARCLALWLGVIAVAMLVNAFLGGAVSEPQSRYQARLWWLVPLVALLAAFVARRRDVRA
jgi:hypothetical protein